MLDKLQEYSIAALIIFGIIMWIGIAGMVGIGLINP
jgi:hypothetical protein